MATSEKHIPTRRHDPMRKLHERIQRLCRTQGIENSSQLAVAIARTKGDQRNATELSLSGPHGWWTGNRVPDLVQVIDILNATGGSADWLLLERGPMFPLPEHAERRGR